MEFKKYPSIENHYNQKNIERWVSKYPQLMTEKYIITEKIHGSNFQIVINGKEVEYCSRNRVLSPDESFYDYQTVMADNKGLIEKLQSYSITHNQNIRVFGELYGNGVQKGIAYSEKKEFRIFDIYIDNKLLPQSILINFARSLGYINLVPMLGVVDSLQEALDFNIRFNTTLNDSEDNNICEGVVIKPFHNVFEDENGSVFYIKKKNAEFMENKSRSNKDSIEYSDKLIEVQDIFKSYLTTNRLQNVFSKEGEITSKKEIGKYIKLMMQDAREDFLKDNRGLIKELGEKEQSKVFGVAGGVISLMLNASLGNR